MIDMGTVAAITFGIVGLVFGGWSLILQHRQTVNQSRQTEIMQQQVEQQVARAFDEDEEDDVSKTKSETNSLRNSVKQRFNRLRNAIKSAVHEDGPTDRGFEQELRGLINARFADLRTKFEQSNAAQQAHLEAMFVDADYKTLMRLLYDIKDSQENATETISKSAQEVYDGARQILRAADSARNEIVLNVQRIIAQVGRYDDDLAKQGRSIESLQEELEELRQRTDPQTLSYAIIGAIGEQLRQMTSH